MDTEQNKALVRRFIHEVLQNLDTHGLDDLLADDFVSYTWNISGDATAGLKKVAEMIGAALSDIVFEIDDLIAEGDLVVARVTSSATQTGEFHGLPASGRRYSIGEIHIFRIAEGKLAEHWHQYDGLGLMSQLGGEVGAPSKS